MMYLGKEFATEIPAAFHDEFMTEAAELLDEYGWENTTYGLDRIYRVWEANKSWLWDLFSRSQYWNGRGQIVISHNYTRALNFDAIANFFAWAGYRLCCDNYFWDFRTKFYEELEKEIGEAEDQERQFGRFATKYMAELINSQYPEVKAVAGQKVSRIMNKVFVTLGLDKETDYLREFTKFADAITPYTVTRHTILSINPIDYWTMSFGHNWKSCHSIDIHGNRDSSGDDFGCCYCSGTESYMLDGSTIIFYTVDGAYNGNRFELEDKVTRCAFHLGEDKFVQGRLYPLCESPEATEAGREAREVVQRLICEAADVPNMWSKFAKGTNSCREVVSHKGTNYQDYFHYPNVGVSYWKGDGRSEVNKYTISVGHAPICPNCGEEHWEEDSICCPACNGRGYRCADCGEIIECEDDVCWVDGQPYCRDCVTWCEYCNEWMINRYHDFYDVINYGTVSDDAINYSDYFVEVEDNIRWYSNYVRVCDAHETEDGRYFYSIDAMMEAGYDADGKLVSEDGKETA